VPAPPDKPTPAAADVELALPSRQPSRAQRAFAGLTLLLLAYVSFEALRPEPVSGVSLPHWDKVLHCGAFAALACTACLATPRTRRALVAVVAALLLYGVAIEALQSLIPGREASGLDLLADGLGIAAGLACARAARCAASVIRSG
jgi:VanZ family protein